MRRVSVLLALTIALVAGSFTPVAAATPVDYVALGDSFASGLGTRTYDLSRRCRRGSKAYPALWAASHPVSSFNFVACSGATTSDIRDNQLDALTADTDLITITVGGNDVDATRVLTTCVLENTRSCSAAATEGENLAKTQLPARLDATYQAIRTRSPHAKVVVLGYPHLFDLGPCHDLSEPKRKILNAATTILNDITKTRAQAATFIFADAVVPFTTHGVCGPTPWINPLRLPIPESYHPTPAGHANGYLPLLNTITG